MVLLTGVLYRVFACRVVVERSAERPVFSEPGSLPVSVGGWDLQEAESNNAEVSQISLTGLYENESSDSSVLVSLFFTARSDGVMSYDPRFCYSCPVGCGQPGLRG